MMKLLNINHPYGYHTQKITTMFFPLDKIVTENLEGVSVNDIAEQTDDDLCVITAIDQKEITAFCRFYSKRQSAVYEAKDNEDMAQAVSLLLYRLLSEMTAFAPPWGILYGVRPARLMHAKTEELGEDGAKDFFLSALVSEKKTNLAQEVMRQENRIIALSEPNSYSLYVSVPFCPSRCSYCSFVSHSIENAKSLVEPYVDLLCEELKEIAKAEQQLGLRLETIYFGGGTPTTLSAEQLDRIFTVIERHFDLSYLREYTVEAGRPDTITERKLNTILAHHVGRISINPQTFSDQVLKNIGRKHTVSQVFEAYELARKTGFRNINMDLIAGLSGDTLDSFQNSVDTAVRLGAESVTVHNLALKSGAYLVTENEYYDLSSKALAGKMIDYSYDCLKESGYHPYYMYRQSKSLGNLENCGYSKAGYECLYNIFMMDETHTVLSAGAGAVTKLKHPLTSHIERIYNYKYPYEYVKDFSEIIKRKDYIYEFYRQ